MSFFSQVSFVRFCYSTKGLASLLLTKIRSLYECSFSGLERHQRLCNTAIKLQDAELLGLLEFIQRLCRSRSLTLPLPVLTILLK